MFRRIEYRRWRQYMEIVKQGMESARRLDAHGFLPAPAPLAAIA
jgi:hypothetical protein